MGGRFCPLLKAGAIAAHRENEYDASCPQEECVWYHASSGGGECIIEGMEIDLSPMVVNTRVLVS